MAFSKFVDNATRLADYFIPASIAADREAKKLARIFLYSHIFGPFIGVTVPLAIYMLDSRPDYRETIILVSISCFWFFPFLLFKILFSVSSWVATFTAASGHRCWRGC